MAETASCRTCCCRLLLTVIILIALGYFFFPKSPPVPMDMFVRALNVSEDNRQHAGAGQQVELEAIRIHIDFPSFIPDPTQPKILDFLFEYEISFPLIDPNQVFLYCPDCKTWQEGFVRIRHAAITKLMQTGSLVSTFNDSAVQVQVTGTLEGFPIPAESQASYLRHIETVELQPHSFAISLFGKFVDYTLSTRAVTARNSTSIVNNCTVLGGGFRDTLGKSLCNSGGKAFRGQVQGYEAAILYPTKVYDLAEFGIDRDMNMKDAGSTLYRCAKGLDEIKKDMELLEMDRQKGCKCFKGLGGRNVQKEGLGTLCTMMLIKKEFLPMFKDDICLG